MAIPVLYNSHLKFQQSGGSGTPDKVVNFVSDTIKAMLVSSSYTPNASTHTVLTDINNEVSGGNYTTGGITLTSKAITEDAGIVTFDATDITWNGHATGFANARYLILYKSTGTASTSALISYFDLGIDRNNVDINYTISWGALGIITWGG